MSCRAIQHELSCGSEAPEVRSHLLQCAACRAWADDIRSLESRVSAWRSDGPPAALHAHMADALTSAGPLPDTALSRLTRSLARLKETPTMQRRAAFAAGVTVLFAATLAVSASRSNAHTLLSRVQEAMKRVHTAHAVLTAFPNGKPVRHGEMWFGEGKWRLETAGQPAQVYAQGKLWSYNSATHKIEAHGDLMEHFKRVASGGFSAHTVLHELAAAHGSAAPEHSGSEVIGGRTIDRYTVSQTDDAGVETRGVLLVDRANLLPVRFEKQIRGSDGWTTVLRAEFDFNRPIDKKLLDPQALAP